MTRWTSRDRLQAALRGGSVDRPPVWFMRQAGRSLPEYRKLREEHGFREVCKSPELARRVSLQPIDRFGVDAAVVFSDILLPLEEVGLTVRYEEGTGPSIENPLREAERVDSLPDSSGDPSSQARAIESIREERPELGIVGFAGAPFTLACYAIEGGAPKRYEHVHRFRHQHPGAFRRLLDRLAETVSRRLARCQEAGADALQLFDTHAEELTPRDYRGPPRESTRLALDQVNEAATIAYARGSPHLLEPLAELDVDALSLDWRVNLDEAAHRAKGKTLQGNLDPSLLLGGPKRARRETQRVLGEGKAAEGHVFNLGHGVPPSARLETIQAVVDVVREGAG